MPDRDSFREQLFVSALVACFSVGCAASGDGTPEDSAGGGVTAKGGGGGSAGKGAGGGSGGTPSSGGSLNAGGSSSSCTELKPTPLDPSIGRIAADFASVYTAYDLGPIPPPEGQTDPTALDPLGGCTIARDDPNTLLFVGRSEWTEAALYSIHVTRDGCGHISGFEGRPQLRVALPYADVNLIYAPDGTLLISLLPVAGIAQLAPDFTLIRTSDLNPLGVKGPFDWFSSGLAAGESPGGIAFVPPYLSAKGELRAVGYPSGNWFHLGTAQDASGLSISSSQQVMTLQNWPGAIAYVPPGSPKFDKPAALVTEWNTGGWADFTPQKNDYPVATDEHVAAYQVDENGDPILSSRTPFFEFFYLPWGGYFEQVTGDFLFLSWGKHPDHVVAVRGFVAPPVPE